MQSMTRSFVILLCTVVAAGACTTAIVSGKATADGRPLLLKHRDSDFLENKVMYFSDGRYDYIGLVNAGDSEGKEVWAGCNSAGFAIMNSASYNLNTRDTSKVKDREGLLMKEALKTCASVDDFETFLTLAKKPLGVEANFGVIDRQGNGAYFETGQFTFRKFDVNDPVVAPFGYLIRTNFSYIGDREHDMGVVRYNTTTALFLKASLAGKITLPFLLQDISRCTRNAFTEVDWSKNLPIEESNHIVDCQDFIPRSSTCASVVVQGVKAGENPALTTMWTVLGLPFCSVALPVWVAGGKNLPNALVGDASGKAPQSTRAFELRKKCFPVKGRVSQNYIDLAVIMNQKGTGIWQRLRPAENEIMATAERNLELWHSSAINARTVEEFYHWLDQRVVAAYEMVK